MTGQHVKEKLKSIGVNLSELSSTLGYESSQRLHSALKSNDVKSGLLENIAKAINRDVKWFYENNHEDRSTTVNSETNTLLLSRINEKMDNIITILTEKR